VYNDQESRRTLVDAHRVYFHPGIARSEIAEGTRRAERQLEHDFALYAPGARAERHLGPLERVRLVFDTRGYPEIRERLAARFAELAQPFGDRFQLDFAEDLTPPVALADAAAAAREEFARARSRPEGAIAEGILHSRYVGLIHELRTLAHYDDKGYEILQSGRDLLSDEGMYLTEIDAVVVSPKNRLSLVEAKSMRVPMSSKDALKQKILPKLRGFAKDRALLETRLGHPVKRIVFVVDPGENRKLVDYLRGKQKELSKEYGFRVSFLFLSEEAAR